MQNKFLHSSMLLWEKATEATAKEHLSREASINFKKCFFGLFTLVYTRLMTPVHPSTFVYTHLVTCQAF